MKIICKMTKFKFLQKMSFLTIMQIPSKVLLDLLQLIGAELTGEWHTSSETALNSVWKDVKDYKKKIIKLYTTARKVGELWILAGGKCSCKGIIVND